MSRLLSDDVSHLHSELPILISNRQLVESMPIPVCIYDPGGFIVSYNPAAAELWGQRPEVGKARWTGAWKLRDSNHARIAAEDTPVARALRHGKATTTGKLVLERPNGQRLHVISEVQPLKDEQGTLVGAVEVTEHQVTDSDLTEQVELLRQSEERYHRMIEEVEDYVIILLDINGYIQNWNKGAKNIKGYTSNEILGRHFTIFYSEEDLKNGTAERLLKQAAAEGKAVHEGWRVRKDGSRFWGSVVLTALHDHNGDVVGFTKVTRDLTDKRNAENKLLATSQALEQKNRELERINEELSSFAYISSHDLQEPLRKIQTFSDRILEMEHDQLSDKGKDYFRRMQAGAAQMQKLIRDILAYSQATATEKKLEMCDLNKVVQQAKMELEVPIAQKNAVIETGKLPVVRVIAHQIQQLFNNLLSNALKFAKEDVPPHIQIQCELVEGKHIEPFVVVPSDQYYHITISDNGIGFDAEYKKKIFEVFQRLHRRNEYTGTGIGLAICKKIVENHHGFITADGEPGQGARFHIYLPRV